MLTFSFIEENMYQILNCNDSLIRARIGPHQLVSLSYLASSQSMRETAYIFCLLKSTVHQIVKDVYSDLLQLCNRLGLI